MTSISFVSTLLAKWRKKIKRMGAVEQHRKFDHLNTQVSPDFQADGTRNTKRGFEPRLSAPFCFLERCGNDPSAGSPTETLLRLHLPLNDEV
jgi:hypothetical protein